MVQAHFIVHDNSVKYQKLAQNENSSFSYIPSSDVVLLHHWSRQAVLNSRLSCLSCKLEIWQIYVTGRKNILVSRVCTLPVLEGSESVHMSCALHCIPSYTFLFFVNICKSRCLHVMLSYLPIAVLFASELVFGFIGEETRTLFHWDLSGLIMV